MVGVAVVGHYCELQPGMSQPSDLSLKLLNVCNFNMAPYFKLMSSTYLAIVSLYTLILGKTSLILSMLTLLNNSLNVLYTL